MSARDRYPAGVPWRVDTLQPDVRAAVDFHARPFGWEFAGRGPMPGGPPGQYFAARVRGRDVAGIGSPRDSSASRAPAWNSTLHGEVVVPPHDALGFRSALLADPQGAVFSVNELTAGRQEPDGGS